MLIQFKESFKESIKIHGSKSYANRALILGAIDSRPCLIKNIPNVSDVLLMIEGLQRLGLKIVHKGSEVLIENSFPDCENGPQTLETKDGGTTNRFLVALCALGKEKYTLKASRRMLERPMADFEKLNIHFKVSSDSFEVQGPLEVSEVDLLSSETTQIISALRLIGLKTNYQSPKISKFYIEMTDEVISKWSQSYCVPVDWSSASYPIAFGALRGGIHIENIKTIDPLQGDSIILEVLKKMGVSFTIGNRGLHIKEQDQPLGFSMDCSHCLDLVPTLAFLASYSTGKSVLRNLKALRFKESDRLSGIQETLEAFEVTYELDEDSLIIYGSKTLSNKVDRNCPQDHRMVMMNALFQMFNTGGELEPAEVTSKSFPDFFNLMKS